MVQTIVLYKNLQYILNFYSQYQCRDFGIKKHQLGQYVGESYFPKSSSIGVGERTSKQNIQNTSLLYCMALFSVHWKTESLVDIREVQCKPNIDIFIFVVGQWPTALRRRNLGKTHVTLRRTDQSACSSLYANISQRYRC